MIKHALTVAALSALALPQFAIGAENTLQSIGTLTCSMSRTDTDNRPLEATRLQCDLEIPEKSQKLTIEGDLYGRGLYLSAAEDKKAVWTVFAPTAELEPGLVEGDYDIVSQFAFQLPEESSQVLVGGERDTVALKLTSPDIDTIDPATRLTLRVSDPSAWPLKNTN